MYEEKIFISQHYSSVMGSYRYYTHEDLENKLEKGFKTGSEAKFRHLSSSK